MPKLSLRTRWWSLCLLLSGTIAVWLPGFAAADWGVRWVDEELRIAAPQLRFVTGTGLERLKNGMAVPYDVQVTLGRTGQREILRRSADRFVVSYDLWEERFAVQQVRGARRTGATLPANGAEAWCLEHLGIPVTGLNLQDEYWMRLEVRMPQENEGPSWSPEQGISLAALIELFSRPARGPQTRWQVESAPFRLAAMPHLTGSPSGSRHD